MSTFGGALRSPSHPPPAWAATRIENLAPHTASVSAQRTAAAVVLPGWSAPVGRWGDADGAACAGTRPLPDSPVPGCVQRAHASARQHRRSWQPAPVAPPHRAWAAGQPPADEVLCARPGLAAVRLCGGRREGACPQSAQHPGLRGWSVVGMAVPLQGPGQPAMLNSGKLQPSLKEDCRCPTRVRMWLSLAVTAARAWQGVERAGCGCRGGAVLPWVTLKLWVGGLQRGGAKPARREELRVAHHPAYWHSGHGGSWKQPGPSASGRARPCGAMLGSGRTRRGAGGRAEPPLACRRQDNPRLTPFTHTAQHP
ncbi:uncharacterized protein LOC119155206 [Falco rusticolus]|uniref:uncharacterized protein LOC119155206 n=1 Tax=Falco rusticolus TaxID=120794 RepID=UPI001886A983|nr:uncharacterized protein LOC119155206 [Falco rusticolus]XP_055581304.1 uncharacterized protein LOC114015380 [Falco cherrug]